MHVGHKNLQVVQHQMFAIRFLVICYHQATVMNLAVKELKLLILIGSVGLMLMQIILTPIVTIVTNDNKTNVNTNKTDTDGDNCDLRLLYIENITIKV